jgi:tripartite-type tricarboxylate transporter receptor subunit TctC
MIKSLLSSGVALTILSMSAATATAQSVQQFYSGRQVTLVVGTAAGSGYDVVGRLVARHMSRYLPGQPNIVTRNMPGAGGIVATNHVANVAENDGSVIAVVGREAIFDLVFSGASSRAKFDPRKFVWLGTPNYEVGMAYAMTASGVEKIEDAMRREVTVAASGATSGSAVTPRLLNALIGTRFKIITGYPGSMDAMQAMERGETDARVTSGWAGPETVRAMEWVAQGKARLLLQIAVRRHPAYSSVPSLLDYAKTEEDRQLIDLLFVGQELGRPFFAPAGVPQDRAAALRKAFADAMSDAEFKAEGDALKLELSPLLADDMAKIVERVFNAPTALVERARAISDSTKK